MKSAPNWVQLLRDINGVGKKRQRRPHRMLFLLPATSVKAAIRNSIAVMHKQLAQLITSTRLFSKDVYLVPGNHDVQRSVVTDGGHLKAFQALREGAVDVSEYRELLSLRQEAFLGFAKQYAHVHADAPLHWETQFAYRGGCKIRIVGLNTALLSQDEKDKGLLRLGDAQLSSVRFRAREENEILLTLSHHPSGLASRKRGGRCSQYHSRKRTCSSIWPCS